MSESGRRDEGSIANMLGLCGQEGVVVHRALLVVMVSLYCNM